MYHPPVPKALRPHERRELFIREYRIDRNGTQAAIRAGYARIGAAVTASRLLREPKVAAEIAKRATEDGAKADLTAVRTLEAIRRPLVADVRKLFDAQGNLRPIHELDEETSSLIAGFETIIKNAKAGDGKTDEVLKIRIVDRARFVEMAAKHFALLTERIEHSGEVAFTWQR